MIAFGGAAPLHAGRLCEKLGVSRLLVPQGAGVGSAIGFLRAPFSFEATRSVYMKLSDFDAGVVADLLAGLAEEATGFVRSCDANAPITSEFRAYMRYTGQGWEIPVSLTPDQAKTPNVETFLQLFEQDYASLFGRPVAGMDVEITVWAVNATTPRAEVAQVVDVADAGAATFNQSRALFDPALGQRTDAHVIARTQMAEGARVEGPALIVEDETTIVLPSSRTARMQADGTIDVRMKEGTA